MIQIKKKLDLPSSLYAQKNFLQLEKRRLIDEWLPPGYGARISEIEREFAQKEETASSNIESLAVEIRADTLTLGRSVRGSDYQAAWSRERVSCDDKPLRL